jgi:hypothetical protein
MLQMSRVNKVQNLNTSEKKDLKAEDLLNNDVADDASSACKTHIRRIVISCDASAEELKHGVEVAIPSAVDIFRPEQTAKEGEHAQLDVDKGIITNMKLLSVSSNCNDSVTMSMNLYDNNPDITNTAGHLYTPQETDMQSQVHVRKTADGFINLANILPYERYRGQTNIYSPDNVVSNQFINSYGGHTLESLWDNIVKFPNKDFFYVPEEHIVLKIIKQNWQVLGLNLASEKTRDNHYKIPKKVFNDVVEQLYHSVISNIPYTSFSSLKGRFQANAPENDNDYKIVTEILVEYKYPTIQDDKEEDAQ